MGEQWRTKRLNPAGYWFNFQGCLRCTNAPNGRPVDYPKDFEGWMSRHGYAQDYSVLCCECSRHPLRLGRILKNQFTYIHDRVKQVRIFARFQRKKLLLGNA